MYGYIYKTTNLVNGKIYIGKRVSSTIVKRYKGSGKLIKAAMLKYGEQNFVCELLEWCSTNEELNNREKYYIKFYNSTDLTIGYNISKGGDGGDVFHSLSPERQAEIINKTKNSNKNRVWIHKDNKALRVPKQQVNEFLQKGYSLGYTEEMLNKIKNYHKTHDHPINSSCWKPGHKTWNKGIPCSEEKKQKIRETLTGTKQSKETCEKKSKSMKEKYKNGYKPPMAGKVPWNKGLNFVWVANDKEIRYISPDKLQEFLDAGYHRGRKKY